MIIADSLRSAGDEDLFGVRCDDAVESELPRVLAAELKQETGAIARLSIDDIDELHLRRAVEMRGVSDALNGGFDVAEPVGLRDNRYVAQRGACTSSIRRVDIGCGAAVTQRVCLQLLVQQRQLGCRRGGTM